MSILKPLRHNLFQSTSNFYAEVEKSSPTGRYAPKPDFYLFQLP